ncbi:hypothetical protein LSH36_537g00000, partial [Paralvinella palmiformis]
HCLGEIGVKVSHVYSSPALRCIETTNSILLGMNMNVAINVEPALLEWFKWYHYLHELDMEELRRFHLNVNVSYKPFIALDEIDLNEDRLDEYKRCYELTKWIANRHKQEGGDILIVGHLSTMETVTRLMSGDKPLEYNKFLSRVRNKPFGLITVLEEPCSLTGSWRKMLLPMLPISWHARLLWNRNKLIELLLK